MATKTRDRLFVHDDGTIACPEHFGAYAAAALRSHPSSRLLQTPLGTWERLDAADIEHLAHLGCIAVCETCCAQTRATKKGA